MEDYNIKPIRKIDYSSLNPNNRRKPLIRTDRDPNESQTPSEFEEILRKELAKLSVQK